jgi:hypothetical protein
MEVQIDESELNYKTRGRIVMEVDEILKEYCSTNNISRDRIGVTLSINVSLEIHK